jgi:hypothetical protein
LNKGMVFSIQKVGGCETPQPAATSGSGQTES